MLNLKCRITGFCLDLCQRYNVLWLVFETAMFAGTESCIRLVDVDEDGRDDVIFGMTKTEFARGGDNTIDDMKKTCSDSGKF